MAKHKATITITFETNDEKEWLKILDFKRGIASGEFQRELSYCSRADIMIILVMSLNALYQ